MAGALDSQLAAVILNVRLLRVAATLRWPESHVRQLVTFLTDADAPMSGELAETLISTEHDVEDVSAACDLLDAWRRLQRPHPDHEARVEALIAAGRSS